VSVRCVVCGRFIPYAQMAQRGGARFYFEPDSHKGPEVSEWTCAQCVLRPAFTMLIPQKKEQP
jgi:hypothetical protein